MPPSAGLRSAGPVRAFRRFRETRPFWGGLLVLAAGLEIGVLPLGPTQELIHAGEGAFAGLACGALLLVTGAVVVLAPSQRLVASLLAAVVSLASFVLTNLGGFVIGMLLGVLGASMAFGWVPDRPRRRYLPRRLRPGPAVPTPRPPGSRPLPHRPTPDATMPRTVTS